jgi:hypothetical protein
MPFNCRQSRGIFLFFKKSELALGPAQSAIWTDTGNISLAVGRLVHDDGHSLQSSVEVKNTWIILRRPLTFDWRGLELLYFTFYSFQCFMQSVVGRGNSGSTATGYGLDGRGIEFRCGARFTAPVQTGPGVHPAFCTMGNRSLSWGGGKAAGAWRWSSTPI